MDDVKATQLLVILRFLFWMEVQHGPNYIMGGERLNDVINSLCNLADLDRKLVKDIIVGTDEDQDE